MTPNTVSWRHVVAALLAVVAALGAVVVIVRSDGMESVDAATARATRWFVHQPTGRVVLIDGYGGRPLASLDTEASGEPLTIAQGAAGAFVINDATAETRAIDPVELRLGSPLSLPTLGRGDSLSGVGQVGLVVVDPLSDTGSVVPADGETIGFDVVAGAAAVVAPDGGVWSVVDGGLRRTTSTSTERYDASIVDGELSLLGNVPVLLDRDARRVLVGVDGAWQQLPTDADPSELVLQQPGPPGRCAWVASGDELWCVSARGIDETSTVAGLGAGGGDTLAIAGDAAALVERGPTAVVRFDWRSGDILDDVAVTVRSDANLSVASTVDLVWVDDVAGDFVWAVNPWGIEAVDKNATGILVLGDDGDVVDEGESNRGSGGEADESSAVEPEEREPDDNGVDDPPVAMPDAVTARTGANVAISVTANDYDPDGEAIVVSQVGRAAHGTVEIGTASTVVYTPEDGYVGLDEFTYTIVDGNGSSANAAVVVELLPVDATNGSPVGIADEADTGPGVAVVVDILRNDVDPERDSLSIGSFAPPDGVGASAIGEVTETVGPSGLPALRFAPSPGFEGTARFTYRPLDALDALGDDVEVTVEVASSADANRPPTAQPDALRARRGVRTVMPVLVNDIDPDGDRLELDVVTPLPDGLVVEVEGQQLAVTAGPGAAELVPFEYVISDGFDHTARGAVLVGVIDDIEPNRPPVVTADTAKAVVGESVVLDVLVNDVDPDGDPLVIVEATSPDDERDRVDVLGTDRLQFTPAALDDDDEELNARFSYTVSDGNGHEVTGDVTVTVLPEALAAPPFARDDSTFTFVDTPVTIDVLRNDGDPSGSRPTLVGRPGCPAGGVAVVTVDNQVRFDPPAGRSGAFRCTYEVTNARGLRASASIVISVREPQLVNEPPNAVSDRLTVEQETTASIDVTSNDTDPDGDDAALTVVSSTAPSLGVAVRNGNTITFTAGLELGPALINYQVRDAEGAISLGRLSVIVVEPVNEAPIALPDRRTVFGPGEPIGFAPLDNDVDPDDTVGGLELVSVELVAGDGSATRSGSLVTMTPAAEFVGDLVANYTIADGEGLTARSVITLSVLEPLNRSPEAVDDSAEVANGGTVTTAILFNDVDPDGDPLEVNLLGGPSPDLGSASLNGDRSVTFTADAGASGTTSIPYQISDGEFTSSAALSIVVLPCTESAPVAQDAFIETGYQQPVGVDLAALSANGTIVDVAGPAGLAGGVYSPPPGENGNVTVTYGVVNGCRQRVNGVVTIDVNQPPAVQPQAFTLGRGAVQEVPVGSLASDDEALSIADVVGAPSWVGVADGVVLIRPDEGAPRGVTEFSVVVADPGGLTGTVPIAVTVTNVPPVANADQLDVSSGDAATIDLTANDTDPDGPDGQLRVREVPSTIVFTDGTSGSVVLGTDGRSVTINPGDAAGTATFSYVIEDADGDRSGPATVTVAGPQLNQPPFARDQTIIVVVDTSESFTLDAGDPDGDQVTVDDFDDPDGVVSARDGLQVTVDIDDIGTYSFTYRITDGTDVSSIATVTVSVIPQATTTTTATTVPSTDTTAPSPTTATTVATPTTEATVATPTTVSTTTAPTTATSVVG
ncbi:MAG: tandem-95 repeat protein [Ilumatobacteraceae bacterium]|nr:tandem-95 repeat protein [Ilumatobacteraceae bacterium]